MSNLFDTNSDDALVPQEGAKRITIPGIHHKIKFEGMKYVEKAGRKDPNKINRLAEFTFTNEEGATHTEQYYQPETDPENIKWFKDLYEQVEGKWVPTGKADKKQMVKLLNTDYVYFLLDLADAMRLDANNIKQAISKLDNFKDITNTVAKLIPKSSMLISIKLLWENNKNNETSFLKIKTGPILYYPFSANLFDRYEEHRISTLSLSDYEKTNNMVRKYERKAAPEGTASTNVAASSKWKQEPGSSSGNTSTGGADANPQGWV